MKKLLTIFLITALLLGILPAAAFAEDDPAGYKADLTAENEAGEDNTDPAVEGAAGENNIDPAAQGESGGSNTDPAAEEEARTNVDLSPDSNLFKLPDSYVLTEEQIAEKGNVYESYCKTAGTESMSLMSDDGWDENAGESTAGNKDTGADEDDSIVDDEVVLFTDDTSYADAVATALNGEVEYCTDGIALIELGTYENGEQISAEDAVLISASTDNNLPALYVNTTGELYTEEYTEESETAELSSTVYEDFNDPFLTSTSSGYQWYHDMIHSASAWENGVSGEGVIVAVIDSGVQPSHEDYGTNVVVQKMSDVTGEDDGTINHPHGGNVCGTIASAANNAKGGAGIAYGVTLYSYKLKVSSTGDISSMADIAVAINRAVSAGAQVINLSLGGSYNEAIRKACQNAVSSGVTIAAAAGNSGADQPTYPAALSESEDGVSVIAVASVNASGTKSSFSNYGSWVDIAAPGEKFYEPNYTSKSGSNYSAYAGMSGTSQATPVVASAAALYISMYGNPGQSGILQAIQSSATALSDTTYAIGAGIVNIADLLGLEVPLKVSTQTSLTPDTDVHAGRELTFSVGATGGSGPLTYTWQEYAVVDDITKSTEISVWHDVQEGDLDTYLRTVEEGEGAFLVRCKISDGTNTVWSAPVKADVYRIVSQPVGGRFTQKEEIRMSVTVSGGTAPYAYQWQYRKNGESEWENASGSTSYELTLPAGTAEDGEAWRCQVTDQSGAVLVTDEAVLEINLEVENEAELKELIDAASADETTEIVLKKTITLTEDLDLSEKDVILDVSEYHIDCGDSYAIITGMGATASLSDDPAPQTVLKSGDTCIFMAEAAGGQFRYDQKVVQDSTGAWQLAGTYAQTGSKTTASDYADMRLQYRLTLPDELESGSLSWSWDVLYDGGSATVQGDKIAKDTLNGSTDTSAGASVYCSNVVLTNIPVPVSKQLNFQAALTISFRISGCTYRFCQASDAPLGRELDLLANSYTEEEFADDPAGWVYVSDLQRQVG